MIELLKSLFIRINIWISMSPDKRYTTRDEGRTQ
jgi:hypothetical protein